MLGDGGKWPATREDVDALPTRTVSVSETELCRGCADGHHDDDEQGPQCYICLGEYEAGETLRTLPCGHAFHAPCVDKWLLEQRRACPTCRATVPAVKKATPCVAPSRPFVVGRRRGWRCRLRRRGGSRRCRRRLTRACSSSRASRLTDSFVPLFFRCSIPPNLYVNDSFTTM
jgi:hypothetical protein